MQRISLGVTLLLLCIIGLFSLSMEASSSWKVKSVELQKIVKDGAAQSSDNWSIIKMAIQNLEALEEATYRYALEKKSYDVRYRAFKRTLSCLVAYNFFTYSNVITTFSWIWGRVTGDVDFNVMVYDALQFSELDARSVNNISGPSCTDLIKACYQEYRELRCYHQEKLPALRNEIEKEKQNAVPYVGMLRVVIKRCACDQNSALSQMFSSILSRFCDNLADQSFKQAIDDTELICEIKDLLEVFSRVV